MVNRAITLTDKLDRDRTGLNGAIFIHIDFLPGPRVIGVRISTKWKDGGSFDQIATAIGDSITSMLDDLQGNQ